MLNLNQYISSGLFLKNLNSSEYNFDKIIFDVDTLEERNEKVLFLSDKLEFGISGAIDFLIGKSKKFILVLNKFNLFYLHSFLQKIKEKNINLTIVGLNVGTTGIFEKFNPEYYDVSLAINLGLNVYEPVDLVQFFKILKLDGKKYIRIADKDYANNIYGEINGNYPEVLNLIDYGISGESATILSSGYLMPQVLQAIEDLNNYGIFVDAFVLTKYNFVFSDELLDSIKKTEKLIFISDIQKDLYLNFIQSQIYYNNLCEVESYFIGPENIDIKFLNKDYLLENVKLDSLNLSSRITKIIG